jgi:hypothetical protein
MRVAARRQRELKVVNKKRAIMRRLSEDEKRSDAEARKAKLLAKAAQVNAPGSHQ